MAKPNDRRMYWIRNAEAVAESSETHIVEAELGSEARVTGELEYGDGSIFLRPLTMGPDSRGLFKYVLRVKMPSERAEVEAAATKQGYVMPGGVIGELVALASLGLHARFFLLATTLRGLGRTDTPLMKTEFRSPSEAAIRGVDATLFGQAERNFTNGFGPFLREVETAPQKFHLELAVAAERFANALRLVGDDEELVFVSLVSAIERLATAQPFAGDLLSDCEPSRIFRTDTLQPEQLEELTQLIKYRKVKQRFVAFLQQYSEGFLDAEPREPAHTQVTPENFGRVMAAIYDARSGYLHNGDPMYLSQRGASAPGWHMDATVGRRWQDRTYTQNQKLPHAEFFHRLVRHCILARLRELTVKSES